MEISLSNSAVAFGLMVAICAGIYKACEKFQSDLNEETLKAISAWLQNLEMPKDIDNWPKTFVAWFDSVFGTEMFSLKFMFKSALASSLASLFLLVLWLVLRPQESGIVHFTWAHFGYMGGLFLLFNFTPDYLSLMETRLILRFMANTPSTMRHILLLLADCGMTFFIALFIPVFLLGGYGGSYVAYLMASLPLSVIGNAFGIPDIPLQSIFFYTSFFTSIWIWLYSFSGIVVKFLARIKKAFDRIKLWFNIDERPVTFLGHIAILLTVSVFAFLLVRPEFTNGQPDFAYQEVIKQRTLFYERIREKGIYDRLINPSGKGIKHDYTLQEDGTIVHDASTNLYWQQSGSDVAMIYEDTEKYIDKLNVEKYGSYSDWRLPTLEEAMSLMEPEQKNGDLYIDPVFDAKQGWIWTADKNPAGDVWFVNFYFGSCYGFNVFDYGYVRAVRP